MVSALLFRPGVAHASLPPPWQSTDVGNVGLAGSATQGPDGDLFIAGAGSDIWGNADSFQFMYQPIEDGRISILVGYESNTSPFAKFGVMVRQSLDPGSPEVILDVKPDGGVEFMTRQTQGGETTFLAGTSVPAFPMFSGTEADFNATLQLVRSNGQVTAIVCVYNSGCQTLGSAPFPTGPALIGAAVTSHDPTQLNHASVPANMPAVSTVPDPWGTSDVGTVGLRGDAMFQNDTFTVHGAGADIWGTSDSYRIVAQELNGDGGTTARVVSEDATNPFAKAGVILTLNDGPTAILDIRPTGDIEFMARTAQGADMTFVAGAAASFPVYLQLQRRGDTVTGLMSDDGSTWRTVGTTTVSFGTYAYMGLAVTSHDTTVLNTAVFDHVIAVTQPTYYSLDIGDVGISGTTSYSGGVYTIAGSGADIWGTADAFRYFDRFISGDGSTTVRVTSLQDTNAFAKAGVMLRESAGTASDADVILDVRPDGSLEFMSRGATGAETTFIAGAAAQFPVWLRLSRVGTMVTGEFSADGTNWTTIGAATSSIGSSARMGLAVTSHVRGTLASATFDNLQP